MSSMKPCLKCFSCKKQQLQGADWVQLRFIAAMHPRVKYVRSGPLDLFTPGLLATVGDTQINLVDGTLCLSWTPPFTLDITNVDPDLYYIIEITSTANTENPLTISCDDCSSEYKFTVNNSSPCDSFTFIVVPVNGAGNGTLSDPLQGSFIQGMYTNPNRARLL